MHPRRQKWHGFFFLGDRKRQLLLHPSCQCQRRRSVMDRYTAPASQLLRFMMGEKQVHLFLFFDFVSDGQRFQ
ncbi:hypothetical protein BRADI_3g08974v3 [Brachypodium distachyon]|uniref:Uncharacterized protein n=1 Tax=Brachypodium distachyon TaxID=15368 RepID=A0A2K2CW42_BRADI|nr:hypothetical protein BRADI_3g08974v3 [Brachypodium distachyon]